ncbi:MAG: VCBS repeat-containing protein [Anaerolineae bacterium]|nr:VCBS repeat-containing protein [Anaerolineae bacterium]
MNYQPDNLFQENQKLSAKNYPTIMTQVGRIWVMLLMVWVSFLWTPSLAQADDPDSKSGVSPQVISLPSGPGSLEGLGESFEPDLSTGTASYPVNFLVVPGVKGFQPDLKLVYNGGTPNGPWGMGWKLNVPHIQRRTDAGLPSYDDAQDRFIYSSGEKLTFISSNGHYQFENEGKFMRFRRLADGGWEAHTPDGTRYVFGETVQARVTNARGIFRWCLERQIDTNGNQIEYKYFEDGGYTYLKEVRYNFSVDGRYNAVIFNYQPRTDVYIDRTSRSPIAINLRATRVDMWAPDQFVRRYRFTYTTESAFSRHSLLDTITQIGDDGVSELPKTTFTYTSFDPDSYQVKSMSSPPPLSLTNADADLVDINYDSLPDVVYTPAGEHRFYLNRGRGIWQSTPEIPTASPSDRISGANAKMADMDGNGQVDLLIKSGGPFYYYAGRPGQVWEQSDRIDYNLSPNFDLSDQNLRLFDANNDKRIDLMVTTASAYRIWLAREDNTWGSIADYNIPALAVGTPLTFDNRRVKLGDMTGDRLQELVFVRDGLVVYFPYSGNGEYDAGVLMANPPADLGPQDVNLQLGDVNNDGLDDLILPANRSVRIWLNQGDDAFSEPLTLSGTPAFNQVDTAVRLADMDGDGATELLYSRQSASPDEIMQYVDFSTVTQPFLLESIDNGLGRTIEIDYRPATEFYIDDWEADDSWETSLPFPVQVVSRVTVHDANSGHDYITDYHYRDGYYDGVQKEFRGFARVTEIEHGDDTAPTTVTEYVYDTGQSDESRKGLVLEQTVLGEGGQCTSPISDCYRREVNQLETRVLHSAGTGQRVAYSFVRQTDSYLHENLPTPVNLRQSFNRDDFGNLIEEFNYGQVCGSDVTCGDDERLKYTQYAYNISAWIINKPAVILQTDSAGNFVSEVRMYYDGNAFECSDLGVMGTRGNLSCQEENLGPLDSNRFIPTKRQAFDRYGNVVGIKDANGNLTTIEYDVLVHTFPVVETIHLEDSERLSIAAAYHLGFGQITAATDFNGNATVYEYDTFGRLSKVAQPGDNLALPTQEFSYQLGSPRSHIITTLRERSGESAVRRSVTYFDGLGRTLQTRREAEGGQFAVEEAMTFNARQSERDKFLPYYDNTFDYAAPDQGRPHTRQLYDPLSRVEKTLNPDQSFTSVTYRPLEQVQYDEEDNRTGSPHFDTPKTLSYDGLERLIGVQELNQVNGNLEVYNTSYEYDLLDNLTRIVDAQNNIKTMRYDGLSRKRFMDDPDKGQMTYKYDDFGNLKETRDAKGQVVSYQYDAANRIMREQWHLADDSTLDYATYHYDADLWPLHNDAQNTQGQLSYIEDEAGAVYFSYDARGNTTGEIRYFAQEGMEFVTRMTYDATDRLATLTYPDGTAISYNYNRHGLLDNIPGFVDDIDYIASGQRERMTYPNSVSTTYDYDIRLRLQQLKTTNNQTSLQDLTYIFDQASNIVSIIDTRPDRSDDNDQSQNFDYDALYRLTAAGGTYGQINYGYDSIGNMTRKTSTVADDERLNLGEMRYGENGAGPHALTTTVGETRRYDANGNLTQKADTTYTWDHRDQLRTVVSSDMITSTYIYDTDGQRTHQIVNYNEIITQTLYPSEYAEVRGRELVQYIFVDEQRVAQFSTPFNPALLIRGFFDDAPTQADLPPETRWHIFDHLGGTNLLVDESGKAVSEVTYYPFGLIQYDQNGDKIPYQFTGKELDITGLHYFEARYYDSIDGRFISVDPLYEAGPQKGLENPQFLNLYGYALNNPIILNDPTGMCAAPTGLGQGQVAICVEAFIASEWIGGVGKGDNRSFAANNPKLTARVQVYILVDLSTGRVTHAHHTERSSVFLEWLGRQGESNINVRSSTDFRDGSTSIRLQISALNGLYFLPGAPQDTIDSTFYFRVTSEGRVGIDFGYRDAYPSYGIYGYRAGEKPITLHEGRETTPDRLAAPEDIVIERVEPR